MFCRLLSLKTVKIFQSATLEQKKNTTTLTGTETEAAAAKILICARMSLKFFVKTPRHRLRFLRLESRRFTTSGTDVTKI